MKRFVLLAIVLVGVMSMALTACSVLGTSGQWRYKMTVTITTPEGDKTGYAVREVSASKGGGIALPESHGSVSLKGEAVVIDLGQRGVVFALLSGYYLAEDYGSDIPAYIFMPGGGWLSATGIKQMENLKAGPKELELKWYPVMVRFKDSNDPRTVENLLDMKVCPDPVTKVPNQNLCLEKDHFEETFGAGVKLKSITIEMTEDTVTHGIVGKYMPAYGVNEDFRTWFESLRFDDSRRFGPESFKQGE